MKSHFEGFLWFAVLGCPLLATQTLGRTVLVVIAVVWIIAISVVVPLHFYKAWRKLGTVPNKREFAVWVGIETLFAVSLIGSIGYAVAR